jgi:hypothetical protein
MDPPYPYWVTPAQLAYLCHAIDLTREAGSSVVEIGVGRGATSTFLLQHLRTTSDDRALVAVDTFSGFTPESIEIEVRSRGKSRRELHRFGYVDRSIYERTLRSRGYSSFRTIQGDAASVDYAALSPLGVVLLDIDLYQPTLDTLLAIEPHLAPTSFVVVDDCRPGCAWDGALQAYVEFTEMRGVPMRLLAGKGGVLERRDGCYV